MVMVKYASVVERFMTPALKTGGRKVRAFKSHRLRQPRVSRQHKPCHEGFAKAFDRGILASRKNWNYGGRRYQEWSDDHSHQVQLL